MTRSLLRRAERKPSTADFPKKKKRAQHPRDVQGSRSLLLPSSVADIRLHLLLAPIARLLLSIVLCLTCFSWLYSIPIAFSKLARAVQNPASACWYCASASDTAACCCDRSDRRAAFWL